MQEYRHDEAKPLVRLILELIERCGGIARVDWILARWHVEAAELGEGTVRVVVGCGVWTWPLDWSACIPILYRVYRVHTRNEACPHIDEDIRRGSNHRVEAGFDFDRGSGQNA